LTQTITKTANEILEFQATPLRAWKNEKLLRFQIEDPISATIVPSSIGRGISLTNGTHRSAEIINRVNSGQLSPDAIIRILIHD
jgi:hypothetical protein